MLLRETVADTNQELIERLEASIREIKARMEQDAKALQMQTEAKWRLMGWEVPPEGDTILDLIIAYLKYRGGQTTQKDLVDGLIERGVASDRKGRLRHGPARTIAASISTAVNYGSLVRQGKKNDPAAVIALPKVLKSPGRR